MGHIILVVLFTPPPFSLPPARGAVAADGRIEPGDMLLEVSRMGSRERGAWQERGAWL